ncbi:hypothetical protein [Pseudomonas umsongensis]|uniref:hypothetical protein n=1 Tax=Pseudomonas umsongensis TaxID=198618 RepID=UPI00200B8FD5|nr:hypothetical protein [Pseudomonas umsongensis]MCK8682683.1 hypothetical protein [Pseudomonas umsongensis]
MKIVSSLALVVAIGSMSGCATSPQQITSVPLNATMSNPGRIAEATLTPMGNETDLWLFVSGVPIQTTFPARLYTYVYSGSCGSLGAKPAYDLNQTVNTEYYSPGSGIHLRKSVPVAYDTLRSGGYAVVVRGSPTDGGHELFCGKLG